MQNENNGTSPRLNVRQVESRKTDVRETVRDLAAQIKQPNTRFSLVFFLDEYNPQLLGVALKEYLLGSVIGFTTAG